MIFYDVLDSYKTLLYLSERTFILLVVGSSGITKIYMGHLRFHLYQFLVKVNRLILKNSILIALHVQYK